MPAAPAPSATTLISAAFLPATRSAFIAAANPATILDLIALVERQEAELRSQAAVLDGIWLLIDAYADARAEYQHSTARHLAKQQRENVDDSKAELVRALAQSAQAQPVTETGLQELREHLKGASISGDPITLSHLAAGALFYAMTTGLPQGEAAPEAAPSAPSVTVDTPLGMDTDEAR